MRREFANVESVRARPGWPRHGQVCKDKARDASAASTRLRSGGRRWDKAARGRGPSCACNAAAFVLPAHLLASPRQQPGGEERGACLSSWRVQEWLRKSLLRSYFFAPRPCLPATRSPRKEGGPALWHVARRTHARKGKSGLCGCRNLDFDAAQR